MILSAFYYFTANMLNIFWKTQTRQALIASSHFMIYFLISTSRPSLGTSS
ncbi:hypothetical protein STRDD04_01630 [Streptococcus sp. DD04]|nr:hypothetical protein STRDD04_01630 [Streptococcus sp. DD04]